MSTLTTIFRVQDSNGRGPWKPGFSRRWFTGRSESECMALSPFPHDAVWQAMKGLPKSLRHMGHGCEHLDQLRRWFTKGEYTWLTAYGYECVAMRVDRILLRSETQCVFARAKLLNVDTTQILLYPPL